VVGNHGMGYQSTSFLRITLNPQRHLTEQWFHITCGPNFVTRKTGNIELLSVWIL
jgi:hypothetical protein